MNPEKILFYEMRGNIYVKQSYFRKAFQDLQFALSKTKTKELDSQSHVLYILLAKCENQFGNVAKGINYLKRGLSTLNDKLTTRQMADLYMELVINYMTISDVKNVEKYLEKIFAIDGSHLLAHGYNGLFHQNKGDAAKSIAAYKRALESNSEEVQSLHFVGLGYFAQGNYSEAIKWFNHVINVDPDHYAWTCKEMAWYRWQKLDVPLDQYNFDSDVHWLIKDSWLRRSPKNDVCKSGACRMNLSLVSDSSVAEMKSMETSMESFYNQERKSKILNALQMSRNVSGWIQVDSPGFLIHKRLVHLSCYRHST